MQPTDATFEVHPYDRRQPALTFRKRGTINLNSAAYKILGQPEAVLLLFEEKNRRVAVKKCGGDDLRAYPVNKHRRNNPTIPANDFLKHYGIGVEKTTRYSADLQGDMLVAEI